ncbi:MAG: hypothetical protein ACYC6N_32220, partial [Pirellulaceae bacterium]
MHNGIICYCAWTWCWCALIVSAQDAQPTPPTAVEAVQGTGMSSGGEAKVIMGRPGPAGPGMPVPGQPGPPHPPGSQPPGAQPPGVPGTPSPDKPAEAAKEAGPPSAPPNPEEFKVRPDKDGLVQFQFRGQSWPDVLEWFGEIAGMSVDWQELPGDFLNISTQRGYKVEEVRDLLNRLLLTRGYTMLRQDEFVIVMKCEELSAGLVPQVTADELDGLLPHDYVRVMFELDWMLADEAVEELDPLLSKNGEIFALSNTNRIEAMDAVANLREIRRLLEEEQTVNSGEPRLGREYVLQYAGAVDITEQRSQLLGQSTAVQTPMAGMSPEQMAQQQQMMAQMQAQQQQQQM